MTNSALARPVALLRAPRLLISLCLSALLSACALSPGMHMGTPQDVQKHMAEDPAPPGALIPITSELIQKQEAAQAQEVKGDVRRLFGKGSAYTVGPGDVLNVMVWGHPELALIPVASNHATGSPSQADVGNGYNVSSGGFIQFPFMGAVKVSGLTENQIRELLTRKLAKYVKDPELTVRVQNYRHRRVYIDGEVRNPGLQVMDDLPMTLPEAINRAGGFTEAADRSSILLTRHGHTIHIDLPELTRLGVNPNRLMLANGDLLRVVNQDESKIFVMGEVVSPHSQQLRDGQMTLTEAIGEAGGPNPTTSEPKQIYVIRKGPHNKAEIFHLNAKSPTAFVLADSFAMKPHDVVFIDPAPVVRWNRVISMLLPSYGAVVTTTSTTNAVAK